MEVLVAHAENVPEGCMLALTAGRSRRLAPLAAKQKFAFSAETAAAAAQEGGIKVEVLTIRGAGRIQAPELASSLGSGFGKKGQRLEVPIKFYSDAEPVEPDMGDMPMRVVLSVRAAPSRDGRLSDRALEEQPGTQRWRRGEDRLVEEQPSTQRYRRGEDRDRSSFTAAAEHTFAMLADFDDAVYTPSVRQTAPPPPPPKLPVRGKHTVALEARAYLEEHRILHFVEEMMRTLVKERPADPWSCIAGFFPELPRSAPAGPLEADSAARSPASGKRAATMEARGYLEEHRILQFVEEMMRTLVKERPEDPWACIAGFFPTAKAPAVEKPKVQEAESAGGDSAPPPPAPAEPPEGGPPDIGEPRILEFTEAEEAVEKAALPPPEEEAEQPPAVDAFAEAEEAEQVVEKAALSPSDPDAEQPASIDEGAEGDEEDVEDEEDDGEVGAVELTFEDLCLDDVDQEAFKQEILESLAASGMDELTLSRLRVSLRAGSIIVVLEGPLQAVAVLEAAPLTTIAVGGCQARVTKVANASSRILAKRRKAGRAALATVVEAAVAQQAEVPPPQGPPLEPEPTAPPADGEDADKATAPATALPQEQGEDLGEEEQAVAADLMQGIFRPMAVPLGPLVAKDPATFASALAASEAAVSVQTAQEPMTRPPSSSLVRHPMPPPPETAAVLLVEEVLPPLQPPAHVEAAGSEAVDTVVEVAGDLLGEIFQPLDVPLAGPGALHPQADVTSEANVSVRSREQEPATKEEFAGLLFSELLAAGGGVPDPEEGSVELTFRGLSLRDVDQEAFKTELFDGILRQGIDRRALPLLRVALREGSIVVEFRGPLEAVAVLEASPLGNLQVFGCKADITKVANALERLLEKRLQAGGAGSELAKMWAKIQAGKVPAKPKEAGQAGAAGAAVADPIDVDPDHRPEGRPAHRAVSEHITEVSAAVASSAAAHALSQAAEGARQEVPKDEDPEAGVLAEATAATAEAAAAAAAEAAGIASGVVDVPLPPDGAWPMEEEQEEGEAKAAVPEEEEEAAEEEVDKAPTEERSRHASLVPAWEGGSRAASVVAGPSEAGLPFEEPTKATFAHSEVQATVVTSAAGGGSAGLVEDVAGALAAGAGAEEEDADTRLEKTTLATERQAQLSFEEPKKVALASSEVHATVVTSVAAGSGAGVAEDVAGALAMGAVAEEEDADTRLEKTTLATERQAGLPLEEHRRVTLASSEVQATVVTSVAAGSSAGLAQDVAGVLTSGAGAEEDAETRFEKMTLATERQASPFMEPKHAALASSEVQATVVTSVAGGGSANLAEDVAGALTAGAVAEDDAETRFEKMTLATERQAGTLIEAPRRVTLASSEVQATVVSSAAAGSSAGMAEDVAGALTAGAVEDDAETRLDMITLATERQATAVNVPATRASVAFSEAPATVITLGAADSMAVAEDLMGNVLPRHGLAQDEQVETASELLGDEARLEAEAEAAQRAMLALGGARAGSKTAGSVTAISTAVPDRALLAGMRDVLGQAVDAGAPEGEREVPGPGGTMLADAVDAMEVVSRAASIVVGSSAGSKAPSSVFSQAEDVATVGTSAIADTAGLAEDLAGVLAAKTVAQEQDDAAASASELQTECASMAGRRSGVQLHIEEEEEEGPPGPDVPFELAEHSSEADGQEGEGGEKAMRPLSPSGSDAPSAAQSERAIAAEELARALAHGILSQDRAVVRQAASEATATGLGEDVARLLSAGIRLQDGVTLAIDGSEARATGLPEDLALQLAAGVPLKDQRTVTLAGSEASGFELRWPSTLARPLWAASATISEEPSNVGGGALAADPIDMLEAADAVGAMEVHSQAASLVAGSGPGSKANSRPTSAAYLTPSRPTSALHSRRPFDAAAATEAYRRAGFLPMASFEAPGTIVTCAESDVAGDLAGALAIGALDQEEGADSQLGVSTAWPTEGANVQASAVRGAALSQVSGLEAPGTILSTGAASLTLVADLANNVADGVAARHEAAVAASELHTDGPSQEVAAVVPRVEPPGSQGSGPETMTVVVTSAGDMSTNTPAEIATALSKRVMTLQDRFEGARRPDALGLGRLEEEGTGTIVTTAPTSEAQMQDVVGRLATELTEAQAQAAEIGVKDGSSQVSATMTTPAPSMLLVEDFVGALTVEAARQKGTEVPSDSAVGAPTQAWEMGTVVTSDAAGSSAFAEDLAGALATGAVDQERVLWREASELQSEGVSVEVARRNQPSLSPPDVWARCATEDSAAALRTVPASEVVPEELLTPVAPPEAGGAVGAAVADPIDVAPDHRPEAPVAAVTRVLAQEEREGVLASISEADEQGFVELTFKGISLSDVDEEAFKRELMEGLLKRGADPRALQWMTFELIEGSIIVRMRGPLQAVAVVEAVPLQGLEVCGAQAEVTKVANAMERLIAKREQAEVDTQKAQPDEAAAAPPDVGPPLDEAGADEAKEAPPGEEAEAEAEAEADDAKEAPPEKEEAAPPDVGPPSGEGEAEAEADVAKEASPDEEEEAALVDVGPPPGEEEEDAKAAVPQDEEEEADEGAKASPPEGPESPEAEEADEGAKTSPPEEPGPPEAEAPPQVEDVGDEHAKAAVPEEEEQQQEEKSAAPLDLFELEPPAEVKAQLGPLAEAADAAEAAAREAVAATAEADQAAALIDAVQEPGCEAEAAAVGPLAVAMCEVAASVAPTFSEEVEDLAPAAFPEDPQQEEAEEDAKAARPPEEAEAELPTEEEAEEQKSAKAEAVHEHAQTIAAAEAARLEEHRRAVEEERQRQVAELEEQRRVMEEERQRQAAEFERQRQLVAEERERQAAEFERQRKALEEERLKQVAESERRWREEDEERLRKAAELDRIRKQEEEERHQQALEAERRRVEREREAFERAERRAKEAQRIQDEMMQLQAMMAEYVPLDEVTSGSATPPILKPMSTTDLEDIAPGDRIEVINTLYLDQEGMEVLAGWHGVVEEISEGDAVVMFYNVEEGKCLRYVLKEDFGNLIVMKEDPSVMSSSADNLATQVVQQNEQLRAQNQALRLELDRLLGMCTPTSTPPLTGASRREPQSSRLDGD